MKSVSAAPTQEAAPMQEASRKWSEPGEVSRSFRAAPKFAMGMPTKRGNTEQEKSYGVLYSNACT